MASHNIVEKMSGSMLEVALCVSTCDLFLIDMQMSYIQKVFMIVSKNYLQNIAFLKL